MIFDTHNHSYHSMDGSMSVREAIRAAEKENRGIIFTDHNDFSIDEDKDNVLDMDSYMKSKEKYRSDTVLFGIEVGMTEGCIDRSSNLIKNYDFDYVLGGVHNVGVLSVYGEFRKGINSLISNEKYLETNREMAMTHDIDSLAHIDYATRVSKMNPPEILLESYEEYYNRLFEALLDRGICLELNTRRLSSKKAVEDLMPIYRRYKEIGNKYITLGSDAHVSSAVGRNFNEAIEMAEEIGLIIVHFKNRKMEYGKY